MKLQITGFLCGILSHYILSNYMLVGESALQYYNEAHLMDWNVLVHAIVMPFTICGMLIWISALFNLKPYYANKLMQFLYFLYGGNYVNISMFGCLLYFMIYYGTVYASQKFYNNNYNKNYLYQISLLGNGLFISIVCLLFQEIVGHWFGGDIPSRVEGIPNAIVYAMYLTPHYISNKLM